MPLLSNYYLLSVVLGHCGVGRVTTRLCSSQVLCSITKMSRRLHKCKAVISNHTSRYTMAHGSTWEEGGSSGNVHTRGLLSREIFKCEAGWPSLAHPLWPWDSSFLSTSLSKHRWKGGLYPTAPTLTHRPCFQGRGELLRRLLESGQSWLTLSLHFLHPSRGSLSSFFSVNEWSAAQPTRAADPMPRVTGSFSETHSSGNSGLTTATSEIYWQAVQLVKTPKKYSTNFKCFQEPKKKINLGIIKLFTQDIRPDPNSYSPLSLGHQ